MTQALPTSDQVTHYKKIWEYFANLSPEAAAKIDPLLWDSIIGGATAPADFEMMPRPELVRARWEAARAAPGNVEAQQVFHETWERGLDTLRELERVHPGIVPRRAGTERRAAQLVAPLLVAPTALSQPLQGVDLVTNETPGWVYAMAGIGGLLGAVHGYRRNRGSVGWAIAWGVAGTLLPLPTTGVALLQGYGKKKGR